MSAAVAPTEAPTEPVQARPGRWRRVLLRVAFYSVALLVGVPLAFSHVMLKPLRQPASPAPPVYESGHLLSEGLKLRFWCRRGSPERAAVVVVHGVGDTLESYVDRADGLHRRGHTVLLLDLRGHGGSEGRHMTLGGREREDVRAAMSWLRGQALAGRGLILMGHSMGAMAAIRAGAGEPDVRAVILEAPFDTYRDTVAHHARLLYGLPRWVPIIPIAIAFAEWRAGFDADEVDALAAARQIKAPLFAMVDGIDPRMPEPVVRRIVDAHPGAHRLWVVPGVDHVGAVLHPEYWARVLAFLDEHGL